GTCVWRMSLVGNSLWRMSLGQVTRRTSYLSMCLCLIDAVGFLKCCSRNLCAEYESSKDLYVSCEFSSHLFVAYESRLGSKDQEQVEQEQEFISKNTTKPKKSIGAKKNAGKESQLKRI
ncbi:hypothetical protein Tco_1242296, partial [Tanacetum coccineum]